MTNHHDRASRDTSDENELLDAFDAMMARRTPEQVAREAAINAAAHCNQVVGSKTVGQVVVTEGAGWAA